MYKIIVFDKDDTITKAKTNIDTEMSNLFSRLLEKNKVAIITWWDFNNIYSQIVSLLPENSKFSNLFLFPTIWTQMYYFENWEWKRKYAEFLSEKEANYIISILEKWLKDLNLIPEKYWWELIENRWSQITYSALWQKAPLEEKKKFDPDKKIRQKFVDYIKNDLQNYSIGIGWTSSIDITRKWLDKAYWIKKIMENLGTKKEEILFIWDALMPWWNDYAVKEFWIDCVKVNNPEDTKEYLKDNLI